MSNTDEAMACSNLALRMVRAGDVAAGMTMHRRAIALDPNDWRWRSAFAGSLINYGRADEAEAALANCPANEPAVMSLMAFIRWERGDPAMAAQLFRMACRMKKRDNHMLLAHAQATLASGDWSAGFQYHECRERRQQLGAPIPRWDGSRVKRLLVWSDEGVGDAVMFARFIPQLAERVDRVVFGMPAEMVCLMQGYAKYAEILPMNTAQEIVADAEIALMSTPMMCDARPDNLPPDPGVLALAGMTGQLTLPGKRSVGIAWTGNQEFTRRHLRDMPLETMLGLADDPDNQLYGLVVGSRAGDIAKAGAQRLVIDMSGYTMVDFSATAAVIAGMDAVVTTCSGIAHIAGALGVPTFVCLATLPDWRWLSGRSDTPWYPSVTLIRQEKPGEWGPVIAQAREKLAGLPVRMPQREAPKWGNRW